MVQVGRLAPERWREYKELRLEALEADPTAFGSSAEDEAQLSDAEWAKRAQNVLIAFSGGEPIGMIGFLLSHRSKTNHLADIFSVYVRAGERGKGVGGKLLESALKEIVAHGQIAKVKLTVNPKQRAAVKLYRKAGFKEVGRLHRELKVDGRYYDEIIMEKQVSR